MENSLESPMLKMLKSKNPDKDYPSNTGNKWTDEEEKLLLEELNNNIDIELIAQSHKRTIGGIHSRRREIAYKLFINKIDMEEIILKTKLDESQILETIKKKQFSSKSNPTTNVNSAFSIESEINEMKNDIKQIKNTIKELVEMMKAVYEFEDVKI